MLSVLLWIPLVGAIALILLPGLQTAQQAKNTALLFATLALLWTIAIGVQFDVSASGSQMQESLPWLETIGLRYQVGIDGLSFPLIALNSVLTLVAIYSTAATLERSRFYYSLLLLINFGVVGAFLAENLLLFFLFYEIELIPLYLLIGIWGGARRGYAATKFLIYTAVSGIALLGSFLGLIWLTGGVNGFTYQAGLGSTLPLFQQLLLLGALLVGFGIKIPLVPLHTWLPDAHVEASTPISILLAGVLLKLGTYGLLRFGIGLFPDAWATLAPWLASWAVVSVLYGAFTAIAQTDMKKMVAYSSVGHMGYILLAAAATPLSLVAVEVQMISHGLISALLFLLVGVVYQKTGTRDLTILRGLLNPERGLPVIGSLMVLGVMASAGIPGMVGFISEFLVFRSSFPAFPLQTLLCMVGTGLTAVYFLLLVNQAFFGRLMTRADGKIVTLPPVPWGDRAPGIVLALFIVLFGLQPSWISRWSEATLTAFTAAPTPQVQLTALRTTGAIPASPKPL